MDHCCIVFFVDKSLDWITIRHWIGDNNHEILQLLDYEWTMFIRIMF